MLNTQADPLPLYPRLLFRLCICNLMQNSRKATKRPSGNAETKQSKRFRNAHNIIKRNGPLNSPGYDSPDNCFRLLPEWVERELERKQREREGENITEWARETSEVREGIPKMIFCGKNKMKIEVCCFSDNKISKPARSKLEEDF